MRRKHTLTHEISKQIAEAPVPPDVLDSDARWAGVLHALVDEKRKQEGRDEPPGRAR